MSRLLEWLAIVTNPDNKARVINLRSAGVQATWLPEDWAEGKRHHAYCDCATCFMERGP